MEAEYLKSFTIAYYKRRWIFVPLFYIPKDAYDGATGELYRMRVTLMEGQEPLKPLKRRYSRQIKEEIASTICEIILPWQLPIEEVKQLCISFSRKETCQPAHHTTYNDDTSPPRWCGYQYYLSLARACFYQHHEYLC